MKTSRVLGLFLVVETLRSSMALAAEPAPGPLPSKSYTQPQRLVAVDGKRGLNLFCLGAGEPTVLFDAGTGQNMMVWRHVQGQVAALTRACAYDRAGYGFSDPSPRASDARNTVDDLSRLLQAARIRKPIIYVGHSAAGLYGALFAATHPKKLAGAVLVDPAFANQWQAMTASFTPDERKKLSEFFAMVQGQRRACLELASQGALNEPSTPFAKECADPRGYPEAVDDALRSELARQYAQPSYFSTSVSEYDSFWPGASMTSTDMGQLGATKVSFGDSPLVVLTHGKNEALLPGITPAQQASSSAAWRAGHEALAKTSTRGSNRVVANTSHNIHLDQPAAVVDAVRRVLEDVRRGSAAR